MLGSSTKSPLKRKCLQNMVFPTPEGPISKRDEEGITPLTKLLEPGKTSISFSFNHHVQHDLFQLFYQQLNKLFWRMCELAA